MVDNTALNNEELLQGDDRIVAEAKRRFKICEEREGRARKLFLDDLKFAEGDSENGWQWADDIRRTRDFDERPCLTINKTRQHNLQIINDAKQNKPGIKIDPVGNGATYDSAQVFEGLIRGIEYTSNATVAYGTATEFQVKGGIGYWRIITDYVGTDNFDQEIFIRRIKDPLSVYLDPDINEVDGSDARFGFIFEDMPLDVFRAQYPEYRDLASMSPLGNSADGWMDKNMVRRAEYYRRDEEYDELISYIDPNTGMPALMRGKDIPEELMNMILDMPTTQTRQIKTWKVQWYLIVGDKIVEKRDWAGQYVPIVRIIGEETVINGELDRKGHTRAMRDPQRIYNYWSSSAVENVALQSKIPFVADARAIENLETYWETANTVNHSVLPYNGVDDDGQPIAAPNRAEPPVMASAYIQGLQIAQQEMQMVSGQYEANFGQKSNEQTGVAIQERQRKGDNATYHYVDNQAIGIRFTGKILLDLIPKIYDTARVLRIIGEDGEESHIQLDPKAQQAYMEHKAEEEQKVAGIFNPNVGRYDVRADVGPAYATRRQEAFNAISQIMTQAPETMNIIGDLLFRAADFPMASEIAERMERMVPPQAKGEGIPPAVMQLQGELKQTQALLADMAQELGEERLRLKAKDAQKEIDIYEAVTKRMSVLIKEQISPKDIATMLHDLMKEEHKSNLALENAARDIEGDEAKDIEDTDAIEGVRPTATQASSSGDNGAASAQPNMNNLEALSE